jgi:hypothetical protein
MFTLEIMAPVSLPVVITMDINNGWCDSGKQNLEEKSPDFLNNTGQIGFFFCHSPAKKRTVPRVGVMGH